MSFTIDIHEPAKPAKDYKVTVKYCDEKCPHYRVAGGGMDKYDSCMAPGGQEFLRSFHGDFPEWCSFNNSVDCCPNCGYEL